MDRPGLNIIKGEVHRVMSALRNNKRWASNQRFRRPSDLKYPITILSKMSELPLYTALRKGEIATAYEILERDKEAAIGEYSILETLFPLALTTLAELYDKHGVTGTEKQYFDLARTMWYLMPEGEREIPDMLCTFLYAGCKFNQIEFVKWVLPIVIRHPGISFTSLIVDRMYEHNQLRRITRLRNILFNLRCLNHYFCLTVIT